MAQKLDEIVAHVFAFDDDELQIIIEALMDADEWELAKEISSEAYGEGCDCGDCCEVAE